MVDLNDINDIDKIIRNLLIKQSGLDKTHILNAQSIRGPELVKYIEETKEKSPELSDLFIIFDNNFTNENLNFTEKENDKLRILGSFEIYVIIYGDNSNKLGSILKARLESSKCNYDLLRQGIHLTGVSRVNESTDFIKETIWPKVDFHIYFEFESKTDPIDDF